MAGRSLPLRRSLTSDLDFRSWCQQPAVTPGAETLPLRNISEGELTSCPDILELLEVVLLETSYFFCSLAEACALEYSSA